MLTLETRLSYIENTQDRSMLLNILYLSDTDPKQILQAGISACLEKTYLFLGRAESMSEDKFMHRTYFRRTFGFNVKYINIWQPTAVPCDGMQEKNSSDIFWSFGSLGESMPVFFAIAMLGYGASWSVHDNGCFDHGHPGTSIMHWGLVERTCAAEQWIDSPGQSVCQWLGNLSLALR